MGVEVKNNSQMKTGILSEPSPHQHPSSTSACYKEPFSDGAVNREGPHSILPSLLMYIFSFEYGLNWSLLKRFSRAALKHSPTWEFLEVQTKQSGGTSKSPLLLVGQRRKGEEEWDRPVVPKVYYLDSQHLHRLGTY